MRTARSRTVTFMVAGTLLLLAVAVVGASLIAHTTASSAGTAAEVRAAQSVDLLVTVGNDLPQFDAAALASGVPVAAIRRLDAAVNRGQREGLLANLIIWDRSGRVVYSGADDSEGTRPPKGTGLITALSGRSITQTQRHQLDPTSGERTGVLDAFEPLIDNRGRVYGAMEATASLRPIAMTAARSQASTMRFVMAEAALVWLLLMPLWIRLARSQATDWLPGSRRTLRAFRRALDRDQIELVYQPQVEPASRRVAAVEALVRWRCNDELVAPDKFLPAVESSALMGRLTDHVLDLALAQVRRWRDSGIDMRVSVNLSCTDMADSRLPQRVAEKLARHGVSGHQLTVEITETAVFRDPDHARLVLRTLDEMGIQVAVDDFGTGHASIERLHDLPVSEVKVDRSFVADLGPRSRSYVAAMIAFGHNLGLRVVVEGVEDAETLALLSGLGCDLAQGYHISRPLGSEAMTIWLIAADIDAKRVRPGAQRVLSA